MTSTLTRYTEIMALRRQGLRLGAHWACFLKPLEELASELSVCLMDTFLYSTLVIKQLSIQTNG